MRFSYAKFLHLLPFLIVSSLLSSCGGGGSSNAPSPGPSPTTPPGNSTTPPQANQNPPPEVGVSRYFAYAANNGSNDISAYSINATTGALTPAGAPAAAGTNPHSIAVAPNGKFAYVANNTSNDVSAFTINPSTGALTTMGASVPAGANPRVVTLHPSGKFAYVANFNGDIWAYTINATTGALSSIGAPMGVFRPLSVAVGPSGKFAYVTSDCCLGIVRSGRIDTATGAFALGAPVGTGRGPDSITVAPNGKFAYLASGDPTGHNTGLISAYTINDDTGELTPTGAPVGVAATSIMIERSGRFLYVTGDTNFLPATPADSIRYYTIDAVTGGLTFMGAIPAGGFNPNSITSDPTGKFAYVANAGANTISAYTIDTVSGALTAVGEPVAAGTFPMSIAIARTIE